MTWEPGRDRIEQLLADGELEAVTPDKYGRIRRARNTFEYPDSDSAEPTPDDVRDAITIAPEAQDAASTILEQASSALGHECPRAAPETARRPSRARQ